MNVRIVVLNCQKCDQYLNGHKSISGSMSLSYSLSLSLSLSISLYHRSSDTKKNKDIWWTDGNIYNEYNEYDDQDKVKFAEDMNHISER